MSIMLKRIKGSEPPFPDADASGSHHPVSQTLRVILESGWEHTKIKSNALLYIALEGGQT